MLTLGTTNIADIRLGEANVVAAYRGETLVWQKEAEICQDPVSLTLSLRTDGQHLYADIKGNMKSRYELGRLSRVSTNRSRQNASEPAHHGAMLNQFIHEDTSLWSTWHHRPLGWHVSHGYYRLDGGDREVVIDKDSCSVLECPTIYPRLKNTTRDGNTYRMWLSASKIYLLRMTPGKEAWVHYGVAVYDRRRGRKGNGTRVSNVCFFRVVAKVQDDLSLQYRIEVC